MGSSVRLFLLAACALSFILPLPAISSENESVRVAPGLTLPATFRGNLPMASGPGAEWHLDLWPDQTFHLSQRFGDAAEPQADIGRWSADPARRAIVLRGGREAPLFLEVRGDSSLRLMDREGQPIESALNYTLDPGPLAPADVSLPMTGAFRYMADAALFEECLTGRSYPVAMEQDYISAERSYLALDIEAGAPAFAVLEGALALRPAMEGPDRTHLVIDRFDRFAPGEVCPQTGAGDPTLSNTYWRLTELSGTPMAWAEGAPEPFLLLQEGDAAAYNATVGCNMIRGGLTLGAPDVSFAPGAMTMMACPPPLDAAERALNGALSVAVAWDMADGGLTLIDAAGTVVLRAEAAYLP